MPISLFLDLELDIVISETVYDIAHEENNEERLKKYKEYEKYDRLFKIGQNQIKCGLKNWDWKYLAEGGHLCERDFEWFKEEIENAGIDIAKYIEKWYRDSDGKENFRNKLKDLGYKTF